MYHIYFNSQDNEDWLRLFPSRKGLVGNCQFHFSKEKIKNQKIDFFIVFNKISTSLTRFNYNKENSLLIACEPPSVYQYHKDYLDQFKYRIITKNNYYFEKYLDENIYFPWHIGANRKSSFTHKNLNYNQLVNLSPTKKKLISVIRTNKVLCYEHEIRNKIIDTLIDNFGDQIDVFGRNDNYISDKKDALLDYHYHISIENFFGNNFWTEKLSDPLIAKCNPIYLGCKNLNKYFGTEFYKLSEKNIDKNLRLIEKIIKSKNHKFNYEKARDQIFEKYNLFVFLANFVNRNYSKKNNFKIIYKEKKYTNLNFYKRKFRELLR